MKSPKEIEQRLYIASRPVRALWVEINCCSDVSKVCWKSRPVRALWVEIQVAHVCRLTGRRSRPVRALWVEIGAVLNKGTVAGVEACEGLVG